MGPHAFRGASKTKKWQFEANMAPVLEGKSIGSDQKTVLKGELLIWRTKNQARDPGTLQQGFNLLHTSPNWFLGSWTLDPRE
jgi:hypothetical protein